MYVYTYGKYHMKTYKPLVGETFVYIQFNSIDVHPHCLRLSNLSRTIMTANFKQCVSRHKHFLNI